jgi:hypothetical protein
MTRLKRVFVTLLMSIATLSAGDVTAFNGLWKVDVSKILIRLKGVAKYQRTADGKLQITQTDSKQFVFDLDGHSHTDPTGRGSVVITTPVGDRKFTSVFLKDGEFLFSHTESVSEDGKTITSEVKQKNADGSISGFTQFGRRVSGEGSGFWGTWERVSSRPDTPQIFTLRITKDGRIAFTSYTQDEFQYEGNIDGKEYALKGRDVTISYTALGAGVLGYTIKTGHDRFNGRWSLSSDRSTITEEQTNPETKESLSTTIYNRQQ